MPAYDIIRQKRYEARMKWIMPGLSFCLFLLIWVLGYKYTRYVPSPAAVWKKLSIIGMEPETYYTIGVSLRRLFIGLVIGSSLGFVVSLLMALDKRLERTLSVYVFISMTMPSLAIALLCLMVFGLSEIGVPVAVAIITFPFITLNLNQGIKSLDKGQMEMARIYRVGKMDRLTGIIIPHMAPYLFSGVRNAHALGWKIVVVAEVFTVSSGIGYMFNRAYDNFLLADLVVWVGFFLCVVMFLEYVVLRNLEKWTFRWRETLSLERSNQN